MKIMKRGLIIFFIISVSVLFGNQKEWIAYKKKILINQKTFHGWCTEEKVNQLMDLIYDVKPKTCVEIGVFGGSSVYPIAAALKYCSSGLIHAIDPWSVQECLKGYSADDPNYKWWASINLDEIFSDFMKKMQHYQVNAYCVILRKTSEEAVHHFEDESIDILHIDGNHTEAIALNDIKLYFPKVKTGGYIWFDDVNWTSTAKAVKFLMQNCNGYDKTRSTSSCLLFRKP